MGSRRDRDRVAERADAAAGTRLQRDFGTSDRSQHIGTPPEVVLGLAEMFKHNEQAFFPYTPATNLLFGLREAVAMLQEEGLSMCSGATNVTARRRAPPFARGAWRFSARIRAPTR